MVSELELKVFCEDMVRYLDKEIAMAEFDGYEYDHLVKVKDKFLLLFGDLVE